jgi:uncharacterized surface protein with fasciclin (FAS1) repeats
MWEALQTIENIKHFRRCCELANMVNLLNDPNQRFTVFVFTDTGFSAMATMCPELVGPESSPILANIAKGHVAASVVEPSMVLPGMVIKMQNQSSIPLTISSSEMTINKRKILRATLYDGGIIYFIDNPFFSN